MIGGNEVKGISINSKNTLVILAKAGVSLLILQIPAFAGMTTIIGRKVANGLSGLTPDNDEVKWKA